MSLLGFRNAIERSLSENGRPVKVSRNIFLDSNDQPWEHLKTNLHLQDSSDFWMGCCQRTEVCRKWCDIAIAVSIVMLCK